MITGLLVLITTLAWLYKYRKSLMRIIEELAKVPCRLQIEALESKIGELELENSRLQKEVQENNKWWLVRPDQAIGISSPLTDISHWHWPDPWYACNKQYWWETFCPNCKRPVDVSFVWTGRQDPGECKGSGETETAPPLAEGSNLKQLPSTSSCPISACNRSFFWLRNGVLVERGLWHEQMESSGPLASYKVVSSSIYGCTPGQILDLSHEDMHDPLSHRGGKLGMGFDIVAKALSHQSPPPRTRAYVAALWGSLPGFMLGALVLGCALRRSGTKYDLVLLVPADVPKNWRTVLAHVWKLELVPFVDASPGLSSKKGGRFYGVFNKLHVLGLVNYEKVLMLDLDLVIIKCPDELFELKAPAAMSRSVASKPHGSKLNGRHFFLGEHVVDGHNLQPWCQGGGINAGVMLFSPDAKEHQRAINEVTAIVHPERIPGAGPEQDYLSRFYAPWWSHISTYWNYQLHRVFHGADPREDELWISDRVKMEIDQIGIMHFSGHKKIWDGIFENCTETPADIVEKLLQDWASKDSWKEVLTAISNQARVCDGLNEVNADSSDPNGFSPQKRKEIQLIVDTVRNAGLKGVKQWFNDLNELQTRFPLLPKPDELIQLLNNPSWPADSGYKRDEEVWAWCSANETWRKGTVISANEDREMLNVETHNVCCESKILRNLPYTWLRPANRWDWGEWWSSASSSTSTSS